MHLDPEVEWCCFFLLPKSMDGLIRRASSCLFFALFAILTVDHCFILSSGGSNVTCIQSERRALLLFKHHLLDPSYRLASWTGDNCCDWSGIVCDDVSGHVHKLLLQLDPFTADLWQMLGGKINPSLLDLKHLSHLDLSGNNFEGCQIPAFLGSLSSLRYLNLSYSGFAGMVPHQLGNLTDLRYLDLRSSSGYAESLQWLSRLSSLRFLDMSDVDLPNASDWLEVTNTLPSLVVLRLSSCQLSTNIPAIYHVNFSSLAILDLSYNDFSTIPTWVFKLRSLTSLDLPGNGCSGRIPEDIRNLTSLLDLDLSDNYFNSSILDGLYKLNHLEVLRLRGNELRGTISSNIQNMTSITRLDLSWNDLGGKLPKSMGKVCRLRDIHFSSNKWNQNISQVLESLFGCLSDTLESLDLSDGQLSGDLTEQIGHFKSLTDLDLSCNSISGPIPASLATLSSLKSLYLSRNHFNGTLPEFFGQLAKLEKLYINKNDLEGIVSEAHFANATRMRYLYAYGNPLTLEVSQGWIPPFQLYVLGLGSWHLGPRFPLWLRSQKHLITLDLSNTGLSDVFPSWFSDFSSQFSYLNLSHNQMHGGLPNMSKIMDQYSIIDLSANNFEGPLPPISFKMEQLFLSDNLFSGSLSQFLCHRTSEPMSLVLLDLGNNQLSGKIPNCWTPWKNLLSINLSHNKLSGVVPSSLRSLTFLQSLHLRNNNLSGKLFFLEDFTSMIMLDLGENKFRGTIPPWIGRNLLELRILSIRSNQIHGNIPNELCTLSSLKILDLSGNNLSGLIPKCFNNFSAMAIKFENDYYFRYYVGGGNHSSSVNDAAELVMKGKAVKYDTILRLVTSMDLSSNHLSGYIPTEITSLSNLLSLNLSNNLLIGAIPNQIGNMGTLESIDLSVNQLSGEIPPSMSSLSFLSYLNLSCNNLRGRIPTGTQLQSFNASSFVGNDLCGPPLTKNCSTGGITSIVEDKNRKEGLTVDWFYVSMSLGFAVGFGSVVGPLLLKRSWRVVYFQFLDNMWYKIYDNVVCYCC